MFNILQLKKSLNKKLTYIVLVEQWEISG